MINSILGEGRPLTGSELAVKGKLGVFLQTPFIMNDTVRNNILFGHASESSNESIDEERYQLALRVCSLSHDLKLLPYGDGTGELVLLLVFCRPSLRIINPYFVT